MVEKNVFINGVNYKDYLIDFICDLGKRNATPLEGVSPGGSAHLRFHSNMPLYGIVNFDNPAPFDTTIEVSLDSHRIWTGTLHDIDYHESLDEYPYVSITGVDPIAFLRNSNFNTFEYETGTPTTGQLINNVLRNVGWDIVHRALIDRGETRVRGPALASAYALGRSIAPINVMRIVELLARAEPGFVYANRLGQVVFEGRNSRLNKRARPVVQSFDEVHSQLLPNARYRDNVRNIFRAEKGIQTTKEVERIYLNTERVKLYPNDSITVQYRIPANRADRDYDFIANWQANVPGQSYNFVYSDGSNANDVIRLSNERLRNPALWQTTFTNNSFRTVYRTKIDLFGMKVLEAESDFLDVIAQDFLSQEIFGEKEYSIPSRIIADLDEYNAFVKWYLSVYKNPIFTADLRIPVTSQQAFDRAIQSTVGDLIEVKTRNITGPFSDIAPRKMFIEAEKWIYKRTGELILINSVSDAAKLYPQAVLGGSIYGEGIRMGF